jgi:hypothetical protein
MLPFSISTARTPNGYRFASIEPTGRYEQRTHGALAATGIAGLSPHLIVAGMSGTESPLAMWNNTANGLLNFDLVPAQKLREL